MQGDKKKGLIQTTQSSFYIYVLSIYHHGFSSSCTPIEGSKVSMDEEQEFLDRIYNW